MLGSENDHLALGAGSLPISGGGGLDAPGAGPRAAIGIEYYSGRKLFFLGPVLGLLANHDGGLYGFGGLYVDLAFGDWRITPLAVAGGYHKGESVELGGPFQLMLGGTAAYRLASGVRIGISFRHLSNADLYEKNPGAEALFVSFWVPLRGWKPSETTLFGASAGRRPGS